MSNIRIQTNKKSLASICEALALGNAKNIIIETCLGSVGDKFFTVEWESADSTLTKLLKDDYTQNIMNLVKTDKIKSYLDKSKIDTDWIMQEDKQTCDSINDVNKDDGIILGGSSSLFDKLEKHGL